MPLWISKTGQFLRDLPGNIKQEQEKKYIMVVVNQDNEAVVAMNRGLRDLE